jgi:hypothetical protein
MLYGSGLFWPYILHIEQRKKQMPPWVDPVPANLAQMRDKVEEVLAEVQHPDDALAEGISTLMHDWVKIAESRSSSTVPPPVAESMAFDKMTRSLIGQIFEACGLPFSCLDDAHTQLSKLINQHIVGDRNSALQGGVIQEALEYIKSIPVPSDELVLS